MEKNEKVLCEDYEITPYTLYIKPVLYGNQIYSEVGEIEDEFIVPDKPLVIVKNSCEYFGVTYEGTRDGAKNLVGAHHKVPISISPTSSLFFFPTNSPLKPDCIWVAYEHVDSYNRIDSAHISVKFRNNQTIELKISFSSFQNQMMRTAMLKSKLIQRIEDSERKSFYLFNRSRSSKASEHPSDYLPIK
jgi:competence protein ComK